MVMYVILIQVRRDNNLKMIAPHLPRELHSNLVRDLRRNLSRLKALYTMIPADTIIFPKGIFL